MLCRCFGGYDYSGSEILDTELRLISRTEISKSRDNAWTVVSKRKHTISKVFAAHPDPNELTILGSVNMAFKNGKSIDMKFVAHVILVPDSPQTQLCYMEVFEVRIVGQRVLIPVVTMRFHINLVSGHSAPEGASG
jgi:hypothetical protein